jgi:hypothetical protein
MIIQHVHAADTKTISFLQRKNRTAVPAASFSSLEDSFLTYCIQAEEIIASNAAAADTSLKGPLFNRSYLLRSYWRF